MKYFILDSHNGRPVTSNKTIHNRENIAQLKWEKLILIKEVQSG